MKPAKCGNCGSTHLEYGASEIVDDYVIYPFDCRDCLQSGKEFYKLVFEETVMD